MHECHEKDRINRLDGAVHKMAVDMAKLTTNTLWILRLNLFLAVTVVGGIVTVAVTLLTK
jgi:hypothetical protein